MEGPSNSPYRCPAEAQGRRLAGPALVRVVALEEGADLFLHLRIVDVAEHAAERAADLVHRAGGRKESDPAGGAGD
jgi:hypothetical protein